MIRVGDYLYYHYNSGRAINRTRIVRETKTQWIVGNDIRISKEKLRSIGSYNHTYYKQETPELKEEYEIHGVWRKVLNKLDRMAEKRNHYVKDKLTKDKVNEVKAKIEDLCDELEKLL